MRAVRLAFGLLMLFGSGDANASTCYVDNDWRSLPQPFEPAAPNTHFWLFAPPDWDRRVCDLVSPAGDDAEATRRCRNGRFTLKLFQAPSRLAGRPIEIPATLRPHVSQRVAVIELVPSADLTAGKRYDAHLVDAAGGDDRLVGTFRVGLPADKIAPTLAGIERAVRYHEPTVERARSKRGVITIDPMDSKPGIVVFGARPKDAILFGVWTGPAGQPLDFTQPPLTYEVVGPTAPFAGSSMVDLGGSNLCWLSNFVIPEESEIRIGLRAVDLAGNASGPAEIDVRLK